MPTTREVDAARNARRARQTRLYANLTGPRCAACGNRMLPEIAVDHVTHPTCDPTHRPLINALNKTLARAELTKETRA